METGISSGSVATRLMCRDDAVICYTFLMFIFAFCILLIMKISKIKLRRFEAILTPLASKRRSFISLIFIINCITKCSLILYTYCFIFDIY